MEYRSHGVLYWKMSWRRLFFNTPIRQHALTPTLRSAGFSILEVLIALAVFGIAAGGLLAVLGNHMRDVSYLQDQARAVRIARREMDALQRMSAFEPLEESGAEGRFSWISRMTDELPIEVPGEEFADDDAVLAFLDVEVAWSETEGGAPSKRARLQALIDFTEE